MTITLLKLTWSIAVVVWLAATEPFWHQAILVLGGAAITGAGTIGAAWMMSRRIARPVDEVRAEQIRVKEELVEHRAAIEVPRDPTSRTREND